jgi:hypothetical protein
MTIKLYTGPHRNAYSEVCHTIEIGLNIQGVNTLLKRTGVDHNTLRTRAGVFDTFLSSYDVGPQESKIWICLCLYARKHTTVQAIFNTVTN